MDRDNSVVRANRGGGRERGRGGGKTVLGVMGDVCNNVNLKSF